MKRPVSPSSFNGTHERLAMRIRASPRLDSWLPDTREGGLKSESRRVAEPTYHTFVGHLHPEPCRNDDRARVRADGRSDRKCNGEALLSWSTGTPMQPGLLCSVWQKLPILWPASQRDGNGSSRVNSRGCDLAYSQAPSLFRAFMSCLGDNILFETLPICRPKAI